MNNLHWGNIHNIVEFQDSKVFYRSVKTTEIFLSFLAKRVGFKSRKVRIPLKTINSP
jgi:hypothetical protein